MKGTGTLIKVKCKCTMSDDHLLENTKCITEKGYTHPTFTKHLTFCSGDTLTRYFIASFMFPCFAHTSTNACPKTNSKLWNNAQQ